MFYGAEYVDNASGEVKFVRSIPTGTVAKEKYKVYVYDDPDIIFEMEADQAGTALVIADVGKIYKL